MKNKPAPIFKLPAQLDVEDQLVLTLSHRGRPVKPMELYEPLADHFKLALLQDTERHAWHIHVAQARRHLFDQGFVSNARRGLWGLTTQGHDRAKQLEMLRKLALGDA